MAYLKSSRIQALPDQLISQIAAGEVVERPASVLKELLENAIDAGATRIEVLIEQGGIELIEVRDNGQGIHPEDLPLAVKRHATSKIASLDDLESVLSLGFRGEALASIEAVSKFSITSRRAEAELASVWSSSNGQAQTIKPIAAPVGTTVQVRHLYFNTPARRKFLKTDATEFAHCADVFKRLALRYPDIHFTLHHQHKVSADYATTDLQGRFEQVLNLKPAQTIVVTEDFLELPEVGSYRISGILGIPDVATARADHQYLFVNGRFVRDKTVLHAVKSCYVDLLHGNKQAVWLLLLDMPPREVDVNVHPAKIEVRFRQSAMVHQWVARSIRRVLSKPLSRTNTNFDDMPSIKLSHDLNTTGQHVDIPLLTSGDLLQAKTHDGQIQKKEINAGFSNYSQSSKPSAGSLKAAWDHAWGGSGAIDATRARDYPAKASSNSYAAVVSQPVNISDTSEQFSDSKTKLGLTGSSPYPPLGFAMGCVQGIYLVAQNERGLLLVDIHAAHERILYEKLKKNLSDEQAISSQQLLIPHIFQASDQELATCEAERESLLRLGFDVSAIGLQELSIRTIPHLFGRIDPETLVRDVLRELMLYGAQSVMNERFEHLLQTMACHTAVRAHDELSLDELNGLLRQMEATPNSGRCNHGRPTFYELPMKELDQWFSRGK